jgi:hypothetical protein
MISSRSKQLIEEQENSVTSSIILYSDDDDNEPDLKREGYESIYY